MVYRPLLKGGGRRKPDGGLLQKKGRRKLRPMIMDTQVGKAATVYKCCSSEGEAHTGEKLVDV